MSARKLIIVSIFLFVIAILGGCASESAKESAMDNNSDKIQVVTSFYPLYDFAQKIGGEHVHVVNLIPTGVEAHDWSPRPKDMIAATEAEVFIYNGLGFEGWVESFLKGLDDQKQRVIVEASRGIIPIQGGDTDDHSNLEVAHDQEHDSEHARSHEHDHDHHHGLYDPHIWLSPLQAIQMAENIKNGLIQADETHREEFEAGFATLKQHLEELHADYLASLTKAKRKDIVVSHQAYGYLARDYGLTQVPIMGLSPEAEPTAREMQQIIEYVRENQIQYILFEELASPQLARILAEEAGIETLVFHPIEGLTEDQLRAGEDYLSMMRTNLETLKKALNEV